MAMRKCVWFFSSKILIYHSPQTEKKNLEKATVIKDKMDGMFLSYTSIPHVSLAMNGF